MELFAQDAEDSKLEPKTKKNLLGEFTAATTIRPETYDPNQVISIRDFVPGLYTLRFVDRLGDWKRRDQTLLIDGDCLGRIAEGIFKARRVFFNGGEMGFFDKEPKEYCAADVGIVPYASVGGHRWTNVKYLIKL